MFGQGCEVQTVYAAQRYAYAAKLAVTNWSKTDPLPRLFKLPLDHRLVRPGPKSKGAGKGTASHWRPDQQQEDPLEVLQTLHIREVMGMIRKREGEFKLWQPKWNRPGPPEDWASSMITTWVGDGQSQEHDPNLDQLNRTPGHTFTIAMGAGSGNGPVALNAPTGDPTAFETAWCTMSVSHWRRCCLIVSLPQFFLMKRDEFSADQLGSLWDNSDTTISQKQKRGTSSSTGWSDWSRTRQYR